jgi:hypothetical protein
MCAKLTALIMKAKLSFRMYDVCTVNLLSTWVCVRGYIKKNPALAMSTSHLHNFDIFLAFPFDLPNWAFPADCLITGTFTCLLFPILATWTKYTFLYFTILTIMSVGRESCKSIISSLCNIHNSSLELSYLKYFSETLVLYPLLKLRS